MVYQFLIYKMDWMYNLIIKLMLKLVIVVILNWVQVHLDNCPYNKTWIVGVGLDLRAHNKKGPNRMFFLNGFKSSHKVYQLRNSVYLHKDTNEKT